MTLYTIIPEEKVFEGYENYNPEYLEVDINGVAMQVEMVSGSQARIVRLLSCNANDYLNPSYTPGSMLEFQPSLK
jgi:hypothetical protein